MVNQETRFHPVEFERYMKRLNPCLQRMAHECADGDHKLVDDLLQEAAFAIWQLDASEVKKKGLFGVLKKVARDAMTKLIKQPALSSVKRKLRRNTLFM